MNSMNKVKMLALLTNGLVEEKVEYCINVFEHLMKYSENKKYLKIVLPVSRYVISRLTMPLPKTEELAEIIIIMHNSSYEMYIDITKNTADPEAEATILMGIEITKHLNK